MQDIVKYHNDLNKIRLPAFTELEQNLLFTIITEIRNYQKHAKYNVNEPLSIRLYPQDLQSFCKDSNLSNRETTEILESFEKKFFQADFTIIVKDEERKLIGKRRTHFFNEFTIQTRFNGKWNMEYADFDDMWFEFDYLDIEINRNFNYLVSQLDADFTRFELAEFIALSGKYTKTLYRQLKQFRQTGNRLFKWDDFIKIMDIPEDYRQIDIDARILKPAIKELTAERNLFDTKRIPFKDLKYTKLDKNQQPNPRGRNKVCFIKFEWKKEKVQEELEAEAMERIAENMKNHIPTSADYNAKQEFENYKGVEIFFYDSNNHPINAEIKDFDNGTNQLICYDKKTKQDFKIPFENLQKANKWITEKLQGIY